MNIGDIVGQLMKDGLSPATQGRVQHAVGDSGLGGLGGGLGDILGGVLGGASGGGAAAGASGGGLGDILGGVLGGATTGGGATGGASGGGLGGLLGGLGNVLGSGSGVGGMSKGEVGGLGALAGAILGGGGGAAKGAIGGSAMAILGTLAMSALKNWQAQSAAGSGGAAAMAMSESEIQQMTAPQTAELCLRGMIEAVKSDGNIAPAEVQRIVGKLEEGGITSEEQRFVTEEMNKAPDVRSLVAAIPNREVGAQVYAAALMSISVDTPAERAFLAELAHGAGLDAQAVARLHTMVGAPS